MPFTKKINKILETLAKEYTTNQGKRQALVKSFYGRWKRYKP
jgi:hypothetical protein